MSVERAQSRRRGRGRGLHGLVVERDHELAILADCLSAAQRGEGGVTFVEAPPGRGKSRLLTIAGDMARERGMQVLGAQGSELEREFPFGIAIQLFEPAWLSLDDHGRRRLLAGPARRAAELLTGSLPDAGPFPGDHGYAVIHSLFWLVRNLIAAPQRPPGSAGLTMLVDDVHWSDRPSLRFLAYLAERIADLPVALVVATTAGEHAADRRATTALRAAAGDAVLHPRSLSPEGVAALIRSQLPSSEPVFWQACARLTSGNPFLVVALVEHIRATGAAPDAATADQLEELTPESVVHSVVSRMAAMGPEATAVASAVAVLGEGASLRHAAKLARLDIETASRAADTLAGLHVIHPGAPLSFVHPLVGAAVLASMSPLARGQAHRQAARILSVEGAPLDHVAAHLLMAPPSSDPDAIEALRAAARGTLARGAPESSVRMLKRALAEGPPPDTYSEVLAELGRAELAAGLPTAPSTLEHAISLMPEGSSRVELAHAYGQALCAQGRCRDAAEVLRAALREVDEQSVEVIDELEAAYVVAASSVPELRADVHERGSRVLAAIEKRGASTGQRAALAHVASLSSLQGAARSSIMSLAELSWGDGTLLEHDASDPVWPALVTALSFVDELEFALAICDAAAPIEHAGSGNVADAATSYCRAWPLYEQGRIAEALVAAEAALDAHPSAWQGRAWTVYGVLAACRIQQGALEQAEAALAILKRPDDVDDLQLAFLLELRAQLRLAQRRPSEALADALEAGRRSRLDLGELAPGVFPWRSTAALAHIALGDQLQARRLAHDELAQAQSIGVTRVVIRDLRVLGLAQRGTRGLEALSEAVAAGDDGPPRLEHAQALIDFGGALRRANHRAAAREPLRRGLELSHRGGATMLAALAHNELAATGARPRRSLFTGVEALTPSERRVAELAADGLTTREIAEALFVTPKTVEFHLRHIYRKLNVSTRGELAQVIEGQTTT